MQRSASSARLLVEQLQHVALPTSSGSTRSTAGVERRRPPASAAAGRCHSLAWQSACSTLPKHEPVRIRLSIDCYIN
jgi:hypothetical protein